MSRYLSTGTTTRLSAGRGRRVHDVTAREILGLPVTTPRCGTSTAVGPLGMYATAENVTCLRCLRMSDSAGQKVQPTLW